MCSHSKAHGCAWHWIKRVRSSASDQTGLALRSSIDIRHTASGSHGAEVHKRRAHVKGSSSYARTPKDSGDSSGETSIAAAKVRSHIFRPSRSRLLAHNNLRAWSVWIMPPIACTTATRTSDDAAASVVLVHIFSPCMHARLSLRVPESCVCSKKVPRNTEQRSSHSCVESLCHYKNSRPVAKPKQG